jgi:RNA-directed DNA polymerase
MGMRAQIRAQSGASGTQKAPPPALIRSPARMGRYRCDQKANAEERAKRQGKKKPGTFDFLGLTHICARSRRGKFTVHVRTMRKRLRRSLTAIADWCQEHRHAPVDEQQKTLNAKFRGRYQYYGRPTNSQSLGKFYRGVVRIWRKWLNRRTRGNRMTWERYTEILRRHPLLPPRIRHVGM